MNSAKQYMNSAEQYVNSESMWGYCSHAEKKKKKKKEAENADVRKRAMQTVPLCNVLDVMQLYFLFYLAPWTSEMGNLQKRERRGLRATNHNLA